MVSMLTPIVEFGRMKVGLKNKASILPKSLPVNDAIKDSGKTIPEVIPGILPRDLGLKGFEEIRGIHLGPCPAREAYGTTPYYTEKIGNQEVAWIYQPRMFNEGAHTHLHPADPYYLHVCFVDAGYVKTTILIHEYCHVLWALEENLDKDTFYERFGVVGPNKAAHGKGWQNLMDKFGLFGWDGICPEPLEAKYYVD